MSKLAEAKALLAERGRTSEGSLEDKNGCLCPLGALNVVYTGFSGAGIDPNDTTCVRSYEPTDPDHVADVKALARVASGRLPRIFEVEADDDYSYVYRYNDNREAGVPGYDADVLSLFDDAVALVTW